MRMMSAQTNHRAHRKPIVAVVVVDVLIPTVEVQVVGVVAIVRSGTPIVTVTPTIVETTIVPVTSCGQEL